LEINRHGKGRELRDGVAMKGLTYEEEILLGRNLINLVEALS
jgi:hypothetical protein